MIAWMDEEKGEVETRKGMRKDDALQYSGLP
jgi:hypothetical protein